MNNRSHNDPAGWQHRDSPRSDDSETSSLLGSDSGHTAYASTVNPYHPCRASSCCCQSKNATTVGNGLSVVKWSQGAWANGLSQVNTTIEKRKLGFWSFAIACFLFGWAANSAASYFSSDVLNSAVRDRIRNDWDKEYERHQAQVDRMQILTGKWADEVEAHDVARVAMQTERGEWAVERKKWEKEHEAREKVLLAERQLELEKKQREAEKEKEREKKEKAGIKWVEPQPEPHCLRYGTRKWTAKLDNVPAGYDPILVCRETKALVNGRWLLPDNCENKGAWSGTIGTWYVDFEEAACHTFWANNRDKGCTAEGSGKRHIEARLENLRPGDDWMAMCSSTPAEFHGLKFDGPQSCKDWERFGYWGSWFIEDGNC